MRPWSFLFALVIFLGLLNGSMGGSLFRGTVAFHAKQGGSYYIRALAIPGELPREEGFSGGNPSLSPSGELVAFEREGDIWIARLDGTGQKNLTNTPGYEGCPSLSADGKMIAFNAQVGEISQVHLINIDGTGHRALALGPGNNAWPAFGAQGGLLAFVSDRDGQMEIYLTDAQGKGPKRLTDHGATDMDPALSPDGKKLAFASDRDGQFRIYIMDLDGLRAVRLTGGKSYDIQPAFSPDGKALAFERLGEIFVLDLQTGEELNLTKTDRYEGGPAWGRR